MTIREKINSSKYNIIRIDYYFYGIDGLEYDCLYSGIFNSVDDIEDSSCYFVLDYVLDLSCNCVYFDDVIIFTIIHRDYSS